MFPLDGLHAFDCHWSNAFGYLRFDDRRKVVVMYGIIQLSGCSSTDCFLCSFAVGAWVFLCVCQYWIQVSRNQMQLPLWGGDVFECVSVRHDEFGRGCFFSVRPSFLRRLFPGFQAAFLSHQLWWTSDGLLLNVISVAGSSEACSHSFPHHWGRQITPFGLHGVLGNAGRCCCCYERHCSLFIGQQQEKERLLQVGRRR